ncbi:MAG: hypothetical protein LAO79_23095 [Acidobacteriia bacterium]|nr:hypothetical protein [Terriglobia bacterium]
MKKPPKPTGKKRGKRAELAEWLARERPERVGEAEFGAIFQALAPVSESYLRKLLRESGIELTPMVGGVRQSTLDELESSLGGLLDEYVAGDAFRRQAIRKIVITAKDHARWHPEGKDEMILWMTTWLENPPVFREWVRLRRSRGEPPP